MGEKEHDRSGRHDDGHVNGRGDGHASDRVIGHLDHDLSKKATENRAFYLAQNLAEVCQSISCHLMADLDYRCLCLNHLDRRTLSHHLEYHSYRPYYLPDQNYLLAYSTLKLASPDLDKRDNWLGLTVVADSLIPKSVFPCLPVADNVHHYSVEMHTNALAVCNP